MQSPSYSSGILTADGLVRTNKTIVTSVQISTGGTNDVTVILYDNAASAAGTEIFSAVVTGSDDTIIFNMPDGGVYCKNGVWADITSAGGIGFIVFFR